MKEMRLTKCQAYFIISISFASLKNEFLIKFNIFFGIYTIRRVSRNFSKIVTRKVYVFILILYTFLCV